MAATEGNASPGAKIVLAWALVVIPAAWGLTFTVQNALKLFRSAAPVAAGPVNPGASTPK